MDLMSTFPDFVAWAKTQRAAADFLGLSESMVSLIYKGHRPLQPEHAIRAERASNGLFRCDDLLPGVTFVRSAGGIGWVEHPAPTKVEAA